MRALIGFVAILALAGFAPLSGAPDKASPAGPPGAVHAVALERRGYRMAESPPAGAVHVATNEGLFRSETGDGEWVRAVGLPAGPVTALAIFQREHPVEEPIVAHRTWVEYVTVIYAGARTGLFRSRDLGQTWEPAGAGLPATPLRSLLTERDGAVLALTEEGEIFRSANAGVKWSPVGATLPRPVRAISLDGSGNKSLWAIAGRGLFRSADGGRSWIKLGTPPAEPTGFVASSVAAGHGLVILAGESALLPGVDHPLAFATRDGGETWTRVADSATPFAAVLAVDPNWPGRVYGRTAGGALARTQARCESGPAALCLRDGRFRVEVEWDSRQALAAKETAASPAAAARDSREEDDRGAFWLSHPSNVLLTVQIRDARRTNGHFWIDVDAKTIRGFSLIVTDMATGTSTRYSHPEGQRTKFTDHEAF